MITTKMSVLKATLVRCNKLPQAIRLGSRSISSSKAIRAIPQGQYRKMQLRATASAEPDFIDMVKNKNMQNPVMIYSKTYCPYCTEVKKLFRDELKIDAKIVELDQLVDEDKVHAALKEITKRSTVPQVFISNSLVGGCDDTMAAYKSGRLQQMLSAAGVM